MSVAAVAWLFCLYLALIPLVSPMSEAHHLAYALPGVVLVSLNSVAVPQRWRAGHIALALFWIALLVAPVVSGTRIAALVSPYFLGLLALYLALLQAPGQMKGGIR